MSEKRFVVRPLVPRLPFSLSHQTSLQTSNLDPRLRESPAIFTPRAKRAQVRVACIACYRQRAKASQLLELCTKILTLTFGQCDGLRPSCARCTKKGVVCDYDVEPDTSRYKSIQRRNDALQTELDLLRRLIIYMSTRSAIEAQEAFRRIRTCDDALEVAKSLST